jgi:hypothetical protein
MGRELVPSIWTKYYLEGRKGVGGIRFFDTPIDELGFGKFHRRPKAHLAGPANYFAEVQKGRT